MLKVDTLKKVNFFSDFSDTEIERLASFAKLRHYPKGAVVIKMGELTSSLYLIADGLLKVRRVRKDGKEVIFSILKTGDIFGEMTFLSDGPRSADVLTLTESDLVLIDRNDFEAYMKDNKMFMLKMIKILVKRVAAANITIERLALDNVYERLAHFLTEHAVNDEKTGKKVIRGLPTQADLASIVGASREMVSRIIRDLTTGGFVSKTGKELIINKKLPTSW